MKDHLIKTCRRWAAQSLRDVRHHRTAMLDAVAESEAYSQYGRHQDAKIADSIVAVHAAQMHKAYASYHKWRANTGKVKVIEEPPPESATMHDILPLVWR